MPIYEYQCKACGLRFEELITTKEESVIIPCRNCGSEAYREFSVFSHSVVGGSMNESVDMQIGREANKRWQGY